MTHPDQNQILSVLAGFGLPGYNKIERIGSGYIHFTYKISGEQAFILQRVNKNVFTQPEVIARNITIAASHLARHYPDFPFTRPIHSPKGEPYVYDEEHFPWRLFAYYDNTFTVDEVKDAAQAFSAAAEFGKLTYNLKDVDTQLFTPAINRFHDLSWRWQQFETALTHAQEARREHAAKEIEVCCRFRFIEQEYKKIVLDQRIPDRVTHNDTKINNILFDGRTGKAFCAIDLDTLMPGYFFYDLGDMIRTFVSPVNEEEQDLSKVKVRANIYDAVIDGYLSSMQTCLTEEEKALIPFAGLMMTYIMALRMLTDFLNGDIYYQIRYDNQNWYRARNQLKLLQELSDFQRKKN